MAKFKSRSRVGATPIAGRGQIGSLSGGRTVGSAQEQRLDLIGNTGSTAWQDLLKGIGQNGSDFAQKLASLGIGGFDPMTGPEGASWNKQLLDQLIAQMSEEDKRKYNEQRWNIENIYNSPLNQLARLMGAGLSRDAAIQMLSGSGSGSVSSSLTGDAAQQIGGPSPSEVRANEVAATTGIANSVFSAIGSLASGIGSLGQFGISAATLSTNIAATQAATAGQLLGNKQLSKTLAGIDAASTIIGTLSTAMDAGFMAADQKFESSQDMLKYISDNADKYEPFKAMVDSGALRNASKDLYTLNALNSGYKSWRESRDYGIDRDYIYQSQVLDLLGKQVNIDLASSEIEVNRQNVAESINRVLNDNLRLQNEIDLAQAQIGLLGEQQESLRISNTVNRLDAEWYEANIDDINTSRMMQVSIEAQGWRKMMDNPEMIRKEVDAWLSDRDNARTAIALESIYLDDQYTTALELRDLNNGEGHPLRKAALWWHNMFNFALGTPNAGKDEMSKLGKFAKSSAALLLFRKGL